MLWTDQLSLEYFCLFIYWNLSISVGCTFTFAIGLNLIQVITNYIYCTKWSILLQRRSDYITCIYIYVCIYIPWFLSLCRAKMNIACSVVSKVVTKTTNRWPSAAWSNSSSLLKSCAKPSIFDWLNPGKHRFNNKVPVVWASWQCMYFLQQVANRWLSEKVKHCFKHALGHRL